LFDCKPLDDATTRTFAIKEIAMHLLGRNLEQFCTLLIVAAVSCAMTILASGCSTRKSDHTVRNVFDLRFSDDGKTVAIGMRESKWIDGAEWPRKAEVIVMEVEPLREIAKFPCHKNAHRVAISPLGKRVAAEQEEGTITVWDIATQKVVSNLKQGRGTIFDVSFSPNERFVGLSVVNLDHPTGELAIWDLETNKKSATTLEKNDLPTYAIAFHPDKPQVFASRTDKAGSQIASWNIEDGKIAIPVEGETSFLRIAVRRDGNQFAGISNGTTTVWDAKNASVIMKSKSGVAVESFGRIAYSMDGSYLASGRSNGRITVWETTNYKEIATFDHADVIDGLAFWPGRNTLVSVGGKETALICWDLESKSRFVQHIK
jgi:WD40 repeat protein